MGNTSLIQSRVARRKIDSDFLFTFGLSVCHGRNAFRVLKTQVIAKLVAAVARVVVVERSVSHVLVHCCVRGVVRRAPVIDVRRTCVLVDKDGHHLLVVVHDAAVSPAFRRALIRVVRVSGIRGW